MVLVSLSSVTAKDKAAHRQAQSWLTPYQWEFQPGRNAMFGAMP